VISTHESPPPPPPPPSKPPITHSTLIVPKVPLILQLPLPPSPDYPVANISNVANESQALPDELHVGPRYNLRITLLLGLLTSMVFHV
jgi:hypothetical protein